MIDRESESQAEQTGKRRRKVTQGLGAAAGAVVLSGAIFVVAQNNRSEATKVHPANQQRDPYKRPSCDHKPTPVTNANCNSHNSHSETAKVISAYVQTELKLADFRNKFSFGHFFNGSGGFKLERDIDSAGVISYTIRQQSWNDDSVSLSSLHMTTSVRGTQAASYLSVQAPVNGRGSYSEEKVVIQDGVIDVSLVTDGDGNPLTTNDRVVDHWSAHSDPFVLGTVGIQTERNQPITFEGQPQVGITALEDVQIFANTGKEHLISDEDQSWAA